MIHYKIKIRVYSNTKDKMENDNEIDTGSNGDNDRQVELQRNVSQSDFTCGCCYELMVQATTLNCGHSFCRICLARWFLASKKAECPTCQYHERENAVIYLAWFWRNSDDDLLIKKPARKWNYDDVSLWLSQLGEWTAQYVTAVEHNKIDGSLLLGMDEESIESMLNVSVPLHKKVILESLDILKEQGMKLPANLWEFKALNPGLALFLLYGLKDYPRTTMIYLYFFEYDTLFLPIVYGASPQDDSNPFSSTSYLLYGYQPKTESYIDFVTKFTFIPYWVVARFTWNWMDIHYWTSRFVLANCIALTILEANNIKWLLNGGWRQNRQLLKGFFKGWASILTFVIFWPVIPSFVCDCFFYVALYFSPYVVYKLFIPKLYFVCDNICVVLAGLYRIQKEHILDMSIKLFKFLNLNLTCDNLDVTFTHLIIDLVFFSNFKSFKYYIFTFHLQTAYFENHNIITYLLKIFFSQLKVLFNASTFYQFKDYFMLFNIYINCNYDTFCLCIIMSRFLWVIVNYIALHFVDGFIVLSMFLFMKIYQKIYNFYHFNFTFLKIGFIF
ncbi:hypothetical protein KUTeg_003658 [Tegillarca granosa]|uniref:Bifunctional apoptosis regulator n=1 Tax=Tegillarca granosa TaxID=220873 RepID=A0ABQ9FRJ3_TEGGR|nr:hypothetical protein KUTeg_003658 [Tegillarca granosa]